MTCKMYHPMSCATRARGRQSRRTSIPSHGEAQGPQRIDRRRNSSSRLRTASRICRECLSACAFDLAQRYPVVDVQYASPLTAVTPRNFVQAVQGTLGYASPGALTQLGFIVEMIDARGTTHRSRGAGAVG